jgi:hypothetical protein
MGGRGAASARARARGCRRARTLSNTVKSTRDKRWLAVASLAVGRAPTRSMRPSPRWISPPSSRRSSRAPRARTPSTGAAQPSPSLSSPQTGRRSGSRRRTPTP